MKKKRINGQTLSHNQAMEHKNETQNGFTKGDFALQNKDGVVISAKEAAEYCEYKKQRKRVDIRNAICRSEGVLYDHGEAKKNCDCAVKNRQAAVRMSSSTLEYVRPWVKASGVRVDCIIGGDGETLSKVKAYEIKCALKLNAKELTVVLSPSMLADGRYGGIRKELKRLRRAAGRAVLKACLKKPCPPERLIKISKICSEVGVDYLSLPLYDGCERAKSGLSGKCRLEVFGVETLAEYQRLINGGVDRIVTQNVEEILSQWLKEVEKIVFPTPANKEQKGLPLEENKDTGEQEKQEEEPTVDGIKKEIDCNDCVEHTAVKI